jgi:F0F1-type ATP synthase gamma subunit
MTQKRTSLTIESLEDLNRIFRRLRRSGIDKELVDVISGFEELSVEKK